jgi:hypothetical protein
MYNNDVGNGGVYAYEAYEVKQRVALVRVPFYFINFSPTSSLYISMLLRQRQEHKEPMRIVWPKILPSPVPDCTALKHFLRTIMSIDIRAHTRRQCMYGFMD